MKHSIGSAERSSGTMPRITLGLLAIALGSAQHAMAEESKAGNWTVSLATPGGPLEFELQLNKSEHLWSAEIVNGLERIPVEVEVDAQRLVLSMPHYDSRIELHRNAGSSHFDGQWTKRRGPDEIARVKCQARPTQVKTVQDPKPFLGRWSVQFSDSEDPAIAVFEQLENAETLVGTFLTTTGDYRFLRGGVANGQLVLSCFDGAHAFLFKAEAPSAGKLKGAFWAGNWHYETWTASWDPNAKLPDGFSQTVLTDQTGLGHLEFPDLTGTKRSLAEAEFQGKATIVEIFGSWCPNCHDEAAYLKELRAKYGAKGLKVVGLAFELTGDFDRDVQQLRRYVDRFQVDYPILVAGVSDKQLASQSFPVLDRIRSYPTTLFLDSRGTVRAIYTGFSGPATGQDHQILRTRFEALIDNLLSE